MKLTRISEKKITEVEHKCRFRPLDTFLFPYLDAQLESCEREHQEKVKELFEEIESNFRLRGVIVSNKPAPGKLIRSIRENWQALKERWMK